MMLTYILTIAIVASWLIKMIIEKRFIFQRTILDFPLIFFLISQIISTISSIDQHTSLWGYYSRSNGGLLSTISYLSLFWAFNTHLDKKKVLAIIRYTLISAFLVAAYGIAEHFGIDAQYWKQQVQLRVFSTLGQPNWLAAWLVALIPLTWALTLSKGKRSLFFFLNLVFYVCLLFTKSRSGLIGLAFAYLIFWGMQTLKIKRLTKPFIIVSLIFITTTIIIGSPWTPNASQLIRKISPQPLLETETPVSEAPQPVPFISESGDIRKIVWQGAIETWKNYPIFGTGVETFAYSYYWHRPRAHNDVSEWDFLYNKAHNEYLTILANTGITGLLAYLSIVSAFIVWSLKNKAKNKLIPAFLAGYISILVTNFLGFSVVSVNLLFFLMPAMGIVLVRKEEKKTEKQKYQELSQKRKTGIALIFLLASYFFICLIKFWYADTRFALAEKFNNAAWYENAYQELEIALSLHYHEPYYHNEIAYSLAGLATLADQEKDASLSAQLVELAISESDHALKISPYHLNFWKERAKIFILLSSIDSEYQQNALDTLLKAAEIAPTDAKIYYNLGLLYSHLNQDQTAIKTIEKTIELKPNYAKARYALALFYEKKGMIKEAKEQLNYILEKINPAYKQAKDKLEEL